MRSIVDAAGREFAAEHELRRVRELQARLAAGRPRRIASAAGREANPPRMWRWWSERRRVRRRRWLQERYLVLLAEARDLQRNGDIQGFARKTAAAEAVAEELDQHDGGDGARGAERRGAGDGAA